MPNLTRRAHHFGWARSYPRLAAVLVASLVMALPVATYAALRQFPPTEPMPGRIVYSRADNNVWDLFLADPDGRNEARLTNVDDTNASRSAAGEVQPRWSADAEVLAFTTYDKNGERATIWEVPWTGGTPTPLVSNDPGWGEAAWEWPSGRCIAFSGGRPGAGERATDLFVKCPGEAARRITDTPDVDERSPDWKRQGGEIVYEAVEGDPGKPDDRQFELWVISPDGTGAQRLLAAPDTSERHPRWSPDGHYVAFVSYAYKGGLGLGQLKVLDIETGEVLAYVNGAAGPLSWSPDGQRILFYNTWDSGPQLMGVTAPASVAAPAQTQVKGLYVLDWQSHGISRLAPPAGGAGATNYAWGYSPDWTAGTATPTPEASPTPTASNTPSPTVPPTATSTEPPTPTATPAPPTIYLPILLKEHELYPTPEAPDPTAVPSTPTP